MGFHYWIPLLLSSTVLLRWRNRWTIEIEFFKYFSFTLVTIGYLASSSLKKTYTLTRAPTSGRIRLCGGVTPMMHE